MNTGSISLMRVRLIRISAISLCSATTAAGALITIPLPIPITMQLFGVFLSGFLLGPLWGAISQAVYIVLGLIGFPVFAGGRGGLSVLASPTLGYLIAFPAASAVAGIFSKDGKITFRTASLSIGLAILIIYACGVSYLWFWSKYIAGKPITVGAAVSIGAVPFLPMDIFKGYLAAVIVRKLPRRFFIQNKFQAKI